MRHSALADVVARALDKKRIRKAQLAAMVGVSRMTIHRILTGKSRARPSTLVALSRALDVSVPDLVSAATAPAKSGRRAGPA